MNNNQPGSNNLKTPARAYRKLKIVFWVVSTFCLLASVLLTGFTSIPEIRPETVQEFVRSFRILAAAAFFIGFLL